MNIHRHIAILQWLKKRAISLLIVLLVIAATVILFLFFQQNPEIVKEFEHFGYLGAFLIGLVFTATIILPTPGLVLLLPLGTAFNPILVGLVGGIGGTIGELTGYVLGYTGRNLTQNHKIFSKAEGWMTKRGFITVFLFSLVPILPIDIAAIVAGALRFPIWKFLLACLLGKVILYIVMVQTGVLGWEAILRFMGW